MALWHLLLRTRLNASNPYSLCYLLSHSQSQFLNPPCFSSLSTAPAPAPDATPQSPTAPNTSSLSARMSFIFDQIDEIDKKRQDKDDALQRIRAWRESKKQQRGGGGGDGGSAVDSVQGAARDELKPDLKKSEELLGNAYAEKSEESLGNTAAKKEVELVHPWPEWIELMERLVQQNYFDDKRKDEDGMIKGLGFDLSDAVPAEDGRPDFMRDFWTVQSAVVNFGRDRFDILKSLSRQDLQILVGFGCPSMDKRIVFSGKLLRKHTHLDEGDVCSSCSLRNSCEKAYLLTNKEDEARTLDVMRILLAYGFDPTNESYINQSILKRKSVKTVVRKVLRDVVRLSAIPIDPNLPPPVIKRPPPKVKQPPPPKKRIGRADVEMKKGDWLCPKCDFLNFAKNTVCLQCDAKRPKRQLLPGEWECPECNFLNYRRNTVCFHCEHKRPPDTYTENQFPEKQRGPRISLEKVDRKDISNAWNFDFDDDESDGADVAAFEYADSRKLAEDFPSGNRNLREDGMENSRRPNKGCEDGMENSRRPNKGYGDGMENSRRPNKGFEREYSDSRHGGSGIGFNDFDDEDDGIDSYELVDDNEDHEVPRVDFSEIRADSESEDIESPEGNWRPPGKTQFRRQSKKQMHRKPSSDSDDGGGGFDTDDDLPIHPDWKSSHVADNKLQSRGQSAMKFVSDDDTGFDSDSDDETAGLKRKVNRRDFNAKNRTPRGRSNFKSESFSEAGSDDDLNYRSPKQRKESGRNRPGNTPRNRSGMVSKSNKKTSPNRGFSRSGKQGRSTNSKNESASYLDDERYQRPRRNVR